MSDEQNKPAGDEAPVPEVVDEGGAANYKITKKVKEEPSDIPVKTGKGGTFRMVNGKRVRAS